MKLASELAAGDKIGDFVVVINEPFIVAGRTWYGTNKVIHRNRIVGLRYFLGDVFEDGMTFSESARVECTPFQEA